MSLGKEDPTHKKGKPWSDTEHDLLMRKTREQLELEALDSSRTISWTEHWKNVSSFLKKHRYARTTGACRIYWARIMESQDINIAVTAQTNDCSSASGTKMTAINASDDCYSSKRYIGNEEALTPRSKRQRLGQEDVDSYRAHSTVSLDQSSNDSYQTTLPESERMQSTGPKEVTPESKAQSRGMMAISSLVASGPESFGQDDEFQSPVTTAETLSSPIFGETQQKAWVSEEVRIIQTEIQNLEGDIATQINTVASLEQDIKKSQEEYIEYRWTRDEDLVTGVAKINEAYNTKLEDVNRMLMKLAKSKWNELDVEYNKELDKQSELEGEYNRNLAALKSSLLLLAESKECATNRLRIKESQISRKRTGLLCYKAVANYLDSEEKETC